jgi:CDP-4-dehydro-6-deoxyglucose reductase, E3
MTQWLTLSRAAHVLGISRAALQRRISAGELPSFDGRVADSDLARCFPDLDIDARLDDSGAFERVVQVREQSFGRRVRERSLPSADLLAQRLFVQGQELAEVRRHLSRYHQLVLDLQQRLAALPHPDLAPLARAVEDGLHAVLASPVDTNPIALMDQMLRSFGAQVTFRPSGHECVVEGPDTLLEAALRAGLSPSYGCASGNCGLCKARVISGEVRAVRQGDYPLSAAERQQGCVLMCTHAPVTDVTIETLEAQGPADIPAQELIAKIRAIEPLGSETWLLHLQTPRSSRLRFLAGQGATLSVAGTLGSFSTDLPIASCPCDERNLHFHIRRNPEDDFATRLFAGALKAGDSVSVRGPWGEFVLNTNAMPTRLMLVAEGTGFGPIKGLIEHALAAEDTEAFTLIRVDAPGQAYLESLGRSWAEALDDFQLQPITATDPLASEVIAAIRTALATRQPDGLRVAGSARFVAAVMALAEAAGIANRLSLELA